MPALTYVRSEVDARTILRSQLLLLQTEPPRVTQLLTFCGIEIPYLDRPILPACCHNLLLRVKVDALDRRLVPSETLQEASVKVWSK